MLSVKILIYGSFQGKFFKQKLKENADRIGVRGMVRNFDSGIEVYVEGLDLKVREMVEVIKSEAQIAKYRDMKIERIKHQGFEGFENSLL